MLLDTSLIANLREDYSKKSLDISDVSKNPFHQFGVWFHEAMDSKVPEPNAMTLSTVSKDGKPSARVVLLKGFDERGLTFYTNYNSRKGQEMAENPNVSLVFLWLELQRQVRIEGVVEKLSHEESTAYFQSRPKGSQIGAHASPQSDVITTRAILENKVKALEKQYKDAEALPCPEHWGGYLVKPTAIEFWQGRSSRLHDRIFYTKTANGDWKIERLAP